MTACFSSIFNRFSCREAPSSLDKQEVLRPKKDALDVTKKFVEGKFATFAKAVYVYMDVLSQGFPSLLKDESFCNTGMAFRLLKLSKSPGAFFEKTKTALSDCRQFWKTKTADTGVRAILSMNGVVSPCWEISDFLSKTCTAIPRASMQLLKGISGWSLILGFGHETLQSVSKILNLELPIGSKGRGEDGKAERKESGLTEFLNLVENATYLALGILTVLGIFFGVHIASAAFVFTSALNVTATIWGYYNKNLEQKSEREAVGI